MQNLGEVGWGERERETRQARDPASPDTGPR